MMEQLESGNYLKINGFLKHMIALVLLMCRKLFLKAKKIK